MSTDLQMTEELTKAIQASQNPADMAAAVQAEIEKQTVAAADAIIAQTAADKVIADKAAADAAVAADQGFSRTETIGGREFTFQAANELELERMVNNAYKVAYAVQTPAEAVAVVDTVDSAAVAKAAEEQAAAKAELELQFKRGEISTADYIEKSGAVADYLAKQGVPLESLRATVNQNQNTQFEQDWASATETFKNSPAGADWPGGERNKTQIGLQLAAMNLVDATDKVAALAQAYAAMKSTGMLFPGEAEEIATRASSTTDQVAAKAAADKVIADKAVADAAARTAATTAAAKTAATSSGLFGRSSGAGAVTATVPAAGKIDVPADASPAEILDAWKKAQVAGGKDPNAAFMETFANKRS